MKFTRTNQLELTSSNRRRQRLWKRVGVLVAFSIFVLGLILLGFRWTASNGGSLQAKLAAHVGHGKDAIFTAQYAITHFFAPRRGRHYDLDYDLASLKQGPDVLYNPPTPLFVYPREDSLLRHVTMSLMPRIIYIPTVITPAESQAIIDKASVSLARSQVAVHKGSNSSSVSEIRTSHQTWLNHNEPVVADLVRRMCDFTGLDCRLAEPVMVLRYKPGQRYVSHMDAFDPQYYGRQVTNRVATFFVYLNSVETRSGATVFPRANAGPPAFNYTSCEFGLRVYPHAGSAALFYSLRPDGAIDEFALHGGCPPDSGEEKWAAVLWLRVALPPHLQDKPGHYIPVSV